MKENSPRPWTSCRKNFGRMTWTYLDQCGLSLCPLQPSISPCNSPWLWWDSAIATKKKKTQHFRIVKCYRVYLNLYCFRILEGNRKNRQKHYASCHNETRNSETIFKALDHMVRHKSYVNVPGPRRDLSMIDEDSEQMNIELNRIWEQTLQHRICE